MIFNDERKREHAHRTDNSTKKERKKERKEKKGRKERTQLCVIRVAQGCPILDRILRSMTADYIVSSVDGRTHTVNDRTIIIYINIYILYIYLYLSARPSIQT